MRRVGIWALALSLFWGQTDACTGFQLKAQDGSYIYCRSMEFGFNLESNILIIPRRTNYVGTAPNNQKGMKWTAKYGICGMNQNLDRTLVCDGMNEAGLVVGLFYFPGYAKFEEVDPQSFNKTLGPWELVTFLLSTCASTEDVKQALPQVLVAEEAMPGMPSNMVLPVHYYVSDKNGDIIAIEYIGGKRIIYDDPVGAFTNAPSFDWHLTNLGNYINLSPANIQSMQLDNWKVLGFGQGAGLLGLPGDFTPPSRFVRAALYSHWAEQRPTALETVRLGFHILNTFDIPKGIVRPAVSKRPTRPQSSIASEPEITDWTIIHDRTNLKTYFRTYESLSIQMVDFQKIDFAKPGLRQISLDREFSVEDVSGSASTAVPAMRTMRSSASERSNL